MVHVLMNDRFVKVKKTDIESWLECHATLFDEIKDGKVSTRVVLCILC